MELPDAPEAPAPAAVTPVPTATTHSEARLYEPAKRAKHACRYRDGAWECLDLEHFNVLVTTDIEHPEGLSVATAPLHAEDDEGGGHCIQAFRVAFSHPTKEIVVDWTRATLTVNGAAKQVVPGFSRGMTAALEQRRSVAAPGATLVEAVGALDQDCAAPALRPNEDQRLELVLRLPVTLGGAAHIVSATTTAVWQGASERDAVALLAVPEEQDASGWHWWGTAVPFAVGALAAAGVATGAALSNAQTINPLILTPVIFLGGTVVYGGCCAGCGWFLLDRKPQERQARAQESNRERAALLEKRRALGLEGVAY